MNSMNSIPFIGLVVIRVHFVKGAASRDYIVRPEEVQNFVKAFKELHHAPGINPYNNVKTDKIYMITQHNLTSSGPYWWTTPGLDEKKGGGAAFYEPSASSITLFYDQSIDPR